jgi:membrane protein
MSDDGGHPYSRGDFLRRLASRSVAEFVDDHCPQLAASISYHVLFSIFPLAIVLAGIFGVVVHASGVQSDVVDAIVRNVPLSPSGDQKLRNLLRGATGGLSALGLIGVVGLIYAASGMMAAIRLALNEAWDVAEYRPFLRGKAIDVGLVFVAGLFALLSLVLTIFVRTAGGAAAHVGVDLESGWASWVLGIAVPLFFAFTIVLFLYLVVPAVEVRLAETWPAALLTACFFVLTENLFAVYVQHFANYNAVYGSLGAVIAFMFFTYLSSMVFLLGAEVASEWPRVEGEREEKRLERH